MESYHIRRLVPDKDVYAVLDSNGEQQGPNMSYEKARREILKLRTGSGGSTLKHKSARASKKARTGGVKSPHKSVRRKSVRRMSATRR